MLAEALESHSGEWRKMRDYLEPAAGVEPATF